jgi:hypothetical protein
MLILLLYYRELLRSYKANCKNVKRQKKSSQVQAVLYGPSGVTLATNFYVQTSAHVHAMLQENHSIARLTGTYHRCACLHLKTSPAMHLFKL